MERFSDMCPPPYRATLARSATLCSMLFALSVPADNDRGPQYMDQVLAALHQGNPHRHPVTFVFAAYAKTVRLLCRVPPQLETTLLTQLAAHYPDATIEQIPGRRAWRSAQHSCLVRRTTPLSRHLPAAALRAVRRPLEPQYVRSSHVPLRGARRRPSPATPSAASRLRFDRPAAAAPHGLAASSRSSLTRSFVPAPPLPVPTPPRRPVLPLPVRHAALVFGTVVRREHMSPPIQPSSARTHDREDDAQAAAR